MAEVDRSDRGQLDELRIARLVLLGLPVATLGGAAVVGLAFGPATSILVLAAGLLLGVIALLWGSLRILSGDAPLSPELEALDMATQGVDALASRKEMLLRTLKDLENERGIGKLEDDDFDQLSSAYRTELKGVLRRIDETLAPHRTRAEELARVHLAKKGLAPSPDDIPAEHASSSDTMDTASSEPEVKARRACPKCNASNEADAKFCKECGNTFAVPSEANPAAEAKDAD